MKRGRKVVGPYEKDKTHAYRPWLAGLAKDMERIVEVGVFRGKLTRYLAVNTRAQIFGVDHWKGPAAYPGIGLKVGPAAEKHFRRRVRPWLKTGRVVAVKMESTRAAAHLLAEYGPVFDLVFIDAAHDYESVYADILAWRPLVRPGGILCGHDINWDGVQQAVEELVPGYRIDGGFCWWTEVT